MNRFLIDLCHASTHIPEHDSTSLFKWEIITLNCSQVVNKDHLVTFLVHPVEEMLVFLSKVSCSNPYLLSTGHFSIAISKPNFRKL